MKEDFIKFFKSTNARPSIVEDIIKHQVKDYLTPYIMKESQDRMSQLDVFSELMSKRIIFFDNEVNTETCTTTIAQLSYLHSIDPTAPITVHVASPGGEVYLGLAVYDTMKMVGQDCDVITIATGLAASMGSIFMCGGNRGCRFAFPHTRIMIHQPLSGTGAHTQASDMVIAANETMALKKELIEILAEASGKSYKEVEADCDRDNWIKASDALPGKYGKYGLIDDIITKMPC